VGEGSGEIRGSEEAMVEAGGIAGRIWRRFGEAEKGKGRVFILRGQGFQWGILNFI